MGSQDMTHNPSFYVSLGVQVLAGLVLVGLVVVGIVIAVRAKTGTGKGCGIVMAVAFALQSCLVACWFLITIFTGLESSSSAGGRTQTIEASDASCEISVPKSWINSPELSKEALLGAKDLMGNEYVLVFAEPKQDYAGSLADFARDRTDLLRGKLTTPQIEASAPITINGRSAIRQIARGVYDRMRIAYVITYFESTTRYYRVVCWSLE
jgi:hypothetical protein